MLIRQSFRGLGLDMARLFLVTVDCHSTSEQGSSEPVTMCVNPNPNPNPAPFRATLAGHPPTHPSTISSESQLIGASRIVCPSTWWTAARVYLTFPAVSHSTSAGHAMTPSQQVQMPIIIHCSPDGLELVSGLSSGPNADHRQLQIGLEDLPVRSATELVAH